MNKTAVIWGAGKIGRGFLAEVLMDAGYHIVFVDANRALVNNMRNAKYGIYKNDGTGTEMTVRVMSGYDIFHTSEKDEISRYIAQPGTIAGISVMSSDLRDVVRDVADCMPEKFKSDPDGALDIILCINMLSPAKTARAYLTEEISGREELRGYFTEKISFVETVVLRTAPEPTPDITDPLAALNNGYPEMPMDKTAFKGDPPTGAMIRLTENIHAEEVRKIYTINMAHALMCYIASPLGITETAAAFCDPRVRPEVDLALDEAMHGVWCEFSLDRGEMGAWLSTATVLLENAALGDVLTRLGADVPRKIGLNDRLVGPALLCQKHGKVPAALSNAIAAAYRYDGPGSKNEEIKAVIDSDGISAAVARFSGLEQSHPLHKIIIERYNIINA